MSTKYINTTNTGSVDVTSGSLYVGGVAAVAGDDVVLVFSPSGLLLDTGVTNALKLNSLLHYNSFLGTVGSKTVPIQWSAPTVDIGVAPQDGSPGSGTGLFNLDTGTNAGTINVHASSVTSRNAPGPSVQIKGNNAANVLNVLGGSVGLGTQVPGEAASYPTVNVTGGRLEIGSGAGSNVVSLVAEGSGVVVMNGGTSSTSVTNHAGATLLTQGTYPVGVVDNRGTAKLNHRASTGTSVGTLKLTAGVVDTSGNPSPMTNGATVIRDGRLSEFSPTQVNMGTISIDLNGKTSFAGKTS